MFCPNCRLEIPENTEYCSKCGVKLESRVKKLNNMQCPYCGYYTTEPKCKNCSHWINKSNRFNIISSISGFVHAVPGELKSYKWDNTFVKNNLVIIVAIMGIVVILMLFMNNL
jgi:hypothetical protein